MAELPKGFVWEDEQGQVNLRLPDGFVWEDEQTQPDARLDGSELQGLNRRQKGTLYNTPKGPAFWQGDGWLLPEKEDARINSHDLNSGPFVPGARGRSVIKTDSEMGITETPGIYSRFADAAKDGFNKGFGDAPLVNIDPDGKIIPSPENLALKAGEGALRTIGGAFRGATHISSQAARELGMSDSKARQLEKDLTGFIDTAGIMTVGGVPGYGARTVNKAQRHANRLDDVQDLDKLGIQPFAPALSDTDTLAGLTQTVEKIPFAGGPISDRKVDILTDTANAAKRIADDLSPSKIDSLDEGGEIIQKGLQRFARGEPYHKPIESLPDDELKRLIVGNSSKDISFATKQEAVYESAWRKLPARFKSNNSKNPDLVSTKNSRTVIRAIEKIQERIGVSGGAFQGKFSGMSEKLSNRGNLTIETLRHMRTEVGRMLGRGPDDNISLDRTQLKEVYGAITRDITEGMEAIARRAAADPKVSNSDTIAAFQAVTAFKRADQFTKAGMQRIDKLLTITKANTPERAADRLIKASLSTGQGNLGLLKSAKRSLKNGEWNDMASLVLRKLGTPKPGVKGVKQDLGFSPSTFATEWNKLSAQGKSLIFGGKEKPARMALESLARVSDRIGRFEGSANHSNTFNNLTTITTASGGVYAISSGFVMQALGAFAGSYGYSKLVTNPKFARWLAKSVELSTRPNMSRMAAAQLSQLQHLVNDDPGLEPFLEELIEQKH